MIGAAGIQGYNLYIYCLNNPINMSDSTGKWPKFIEDIFGGLNDLKNKANNLKNKVKEGVNSFCNFISNTVGSVLNINKETEVDKVYGGAFTYENGVGYNTSVGVEKTITFFATAGENFWENGSGIAVNINGYGASYQWGNDTSISINMNGTSITKGSNILGRNYIQYSVEDSNGIYQYHKFSINYPEIIGGVLFGSAALKAFKYVGPVVKYIP